MSEPFLSTDLVPPSQQVPQDKETERAVLSCLLRDPELIPEAGSQLTEDAFYSPINRRIYQILANLYSEGGAVDAVVLMSELQKSGELNTLGGPQYVADLVDDLPMLASFPDYLKILGDLEALRNLITQISVIQTEAYSRESVTELAGKLADLGNQTLESRDKGGTSREWKEVAIDVMGTIEERMRGDHAPPGFPWFLEKMNQLTNGIKPKTVVVVAARPGCGKTALGLQQIDYVASQGIPCGILSTEMASEDLMFRALTGASGINGHKIERGYLTKGDFPQLTKALDKVCQLPIYVDDRPYPTLEEIETVIRKWVKDHGVKLVLIDYLQILKPPKDSWSKEDQVARLSGGLLRIAKRLGIAIILLSQLNRGAGEDKRPSLDRLRDSGSIEQDAHGVVLLHPDPERDDEEDEYDVEIIIGKWRNGRTGIVDAIFRKPVTRFEEGA